MQDEATTRVPDRPQVVVVTVTVPERDLAVGIGRELVEDGLVACSQVGGPIRSIYRWEGHVEEAEEWILTLKSSAAVLEALVARLKASHPYDVPEIVATPVVGGDRDYLDWVLGES
jgi:periplasmic divalent cation tolerance protein